LRNSIPRQPFDPWHARIACLAIQADHLIELDSSSADTVMPLHRQVPAIMVQP